MSIEYIIMFLYLGVFIVAGCSVYSVILEVIDRITCEGYIYNHFKSEEMSNEEIRFLAISLKVVLYCVTVFVALCPVLNIMSLRSCIRERDMVVKSIINGIEYCISERCKKK